MAGEMLCVRCRLVVGDDMLCELRGCKPELFWRAMRPAEWRRWRLARITGMVAARWVRVAHGR